MSKRIVISGQNNSNKFLGKGTKIIYDEERNSSRKLFIGEV